MTLWKQQHLCLLFKNSEMRSWAITQVWILWGLFFLKEWESQRESSTDFPIMSSEHLISLCEPQKGERERKRKRERARKKECLRGLRKRWQHERVCCCPSGGRDKSQRDRKMDGIFRSREWEIWSFMTFLVSIILISFQNEISFLGIWMNRKHLVS